MASRSRPVFHKVTLAAAPSDIKQMLLLAGQVASRLLFKIPNPVFQ